MDAGGGIDPGDDLRHHLGFRQTYRVLEGHGLAVDVALGHRVAVRQDQTAHTAAGQGLNAVGAHTAHSEYQNGGVLQCLQSFSADEKLPFSQILRPCSFLSGLFFGLFIVVYHVLQSDAVHHAVDGVV